jgi:hypothetical protein
MNAKEVIKILIYFFVLIAFLEVMGILPQNMAILLQAGITSVILAFMIWVVTNIVERFTGNKLK